MNEELNVKQRKRKIFLMRILLLIPIIGLLITIIYCVSLLNRKDSKLTKKKIFICIMLSVLFYIIGMVILILILGGIMQFYDLEYFITNYGNFLQMIVGYYFACIPFSFLLKKYCQIEI